jgi:UDP:flavonoid glycosyltransferase YjiC (YdhE family)
MLAFISHGGANSVMEASYTGVPLLCIPLMADQYRNAQMAQYRKIATIVQKPEILEGKLTEAIKQIIDDDRYYANFIN